jgi:hypothetical protein
MDAALRREKGRMCFIIGKGNSFVSKWSRFFEENVSNFPFISTHCKKLVDFSSKPLRFLAFSLSFLGKGERFLLRYALHCLFPPIATRFRGHAPAHHALSEF